MKWHSITSGIFSISLTTFLYWEALSRMTPMKAQILNPSARGFTMNREPSMMPASSIFFTLWCVYEFYNLGIGDPHPISAVNRLGIGDMLEAVTEYFDKEQAEEEEDDRTRVAIVGKPNVGKLPALAVRSVTRFQDVPMYIRQCV